MRIAGDRVLGVLVGDAARAILECFRILSGPPVAEIPVAGEPSALIVESMRQLVPDDGARPAVVDRGVAAGLVERRLKNAGWEVDVVARGAVVRIDRRRRHAPFGPVDGATDLVQVPAALERECALPVSERVVGLDRQLTVVPPLVRVPDAMDDRRELGACCLLGLIGHPRRGIDVVLHRGLDGLDDPQHVGLRFTAERLLDKGPSQCFAEPPIRRRDALAPARFLLLLACERAAEEVEAGVSEVLRQQLGREVDDVPAQVVFHIVDRRRADQNVER